MRWLVFVGLLIVLQVSGCQPSSPQAGSTMTAPEDDATLVFIPAGEFLMGSQDSDLDADEDESPQHAVYLDAYWMDRTEVTNDMYRRCVQSGSCTAPAHSRRYGAAGYGDHPVLGVSWEQAVAYCNSVGRRLPTEAEWEKAARGTDARVYPWGNEPPDSSRVNFDHRVDDTIEVGSYPAGASPYGVWDMAGNVWEWVADGFDEDYYAESPYENPAGGISVNRRVLRGGSWSTEAHNVRVSNRFWGFPGRNDTDGFRCAMDAE